MEHRLWSWASYFTFTYMYIPPARCSSWYECTHGCILPSKLSWRIVKDTHIILYSKLHVLRITHPNCVLLAAKLPVYSMIFEGFHQLLLKQQISLPIEDLTIYWWRQSRPENCHWGWRGHQPGQDMSTEHAVSILPSCSTPPQPQRNHLDTQKGFSH